MTKVSEKNIKLLDKAKSLPTKPGCYLMKRLRGEHEEILYIGKAKNLKSRVSSYFNNSAKGPKTEILVGHITDFEFIITDNESEAFVLENNLIKKHTPKYNIRLKDDKSYPYIQIDMGEPFPRPVYTRRPKKGKKVKLFGPFTTGSNISEVLRLLVKSFGIRDCTLSEFNRRKRPCMLYQIKQCDAPCVGYINEKEYSKNLDYISSFFKGKTKKALSAIESRMLGAAEREEFEYAAYLRDSYQTLADFSAQSFSQNVESDSEKNVDIAAYFIGEVEIDISIYIMRSGLLLGHKNFHFLKGDSEEESREIFETFLFQYYLNTSESLPDQLVVDEKHIDHRVVTKAFEGSFEKKILVSKGRGSTKSLLELTKDHAKENQRFREANKDSVWVGLNKLKELMSLKEAPRVLECYDIAIWQGSSPTASQIVFHEGKPDKKRYRHYNLKELPEGNNDFAMMKEVLTRRLRKGELPDAFVVDGGKAQVNVFVEVLKDFNIEVPVVGIAKERTSKNQTFRDKEVKSSDERLIIPGRINPYILKKCPSLLRILVNMRDEAHRFSRRLHHKNEKKRVLGNWLDEVQGVGPKIKKQIRERLDISISELKKLSEDEIAEKFEVSLKVASSIHEALIKSN